MKNKTKNNEISLIDLIKIILEYKFKLILTISLFIILSLIINNLKKVEFLATTEIRPITEIEHNLYHLYNTLVEYPALTKFNMGHENFKGFKFKNISKFYLTNLFLEEIKNGIIVTDAIIKYNIINKENFDNESSYLNHVVKKASSLTVEIEKPKFSNNNDSDNLPVFHIKMKVSDIDNWENALKYINTEINKKLKINIINDFNTMVDNAELFKKLELRNIEDEIENLKQNHDILIRERLSFLKEQSSIARELNIEINNTAELRPSEILEINKTRGNHDYYKNGYKMIEKEIELINSRKNNDDFIENFAVLMNKKQVLINDKSIENIKLSFAKTPIIMSKNFQAANLIYNENKYQDLSIKSLNLILIFTIIGIIFGILFVLTLNALKQDR